VTFADKLTATDDGKNSAPEADYAKLTSVDAIADYIAGGR